MAETTTLWAARGVPLPEILGAITTRTDMECRCAWEVLDELLPGCVMDILQSYSVTGMSTVQVIEHARKHWVGKDYKGSDREWECMALAIEHVMRREKKI